MHPFSQANFARAFAIALFALSALPARAQQPGNPPADPRLDVTKNKVIERPMQAALANAVRAMSGPKFGSVAPASVAGAAAPMFAGPNPARLDVTKSLRIERPATAVVANSAPADAVPSAMKPDAKENPTVKPGDVKWHASFAEACAAAKKSGKPVLLLHMMGQLDKQFC
jgi:hypothetical protein